MSHSFKRWQKEHPNFVTPQLEKYVTKGDKIVELSSGRGMYNEQLFGVTVLQKQKPDLDRMGINYKSTEDEKTNKLFYNKEDALKHFKKVLREI